MSNMVATLLIELTRRYAEPHRHYHNLRHISDMLSKGLSLSDEQVIAIWFHDAIYVPGSPTNEADSARLAIEQISGWDADRVHIVERIILDTRNHVPSTEESKRVIDLDLSILGESPERYQSYVESIRKEFGHVSEEDWIAGRGAWIEGMIGRDRIFWTPWGESLEETARANLMQELLVARKNHLATS